MPKNKKIFYGVLVTFVLIIGGVGLYGQIISPRIPLSEIKRCNSNSDCIFVQPILPEITHLPLKEKEYTGKEVWCSCECVTVINKKFTDIWDKTHKELKDIKCKRVLCKTCIFSMENSEPKCESNQCIIVRKKRVTINTGRNEYKQGKEISIIILNELNQSILISSCPYGERFVEVEKKNPSGTWEGLSLPIITTICTSPKSLTPFKSYTYPWDEFMTPSFKISDLNPPGAYRIKFGYLASLPYSPENTHWIYSNEFTIK